MISFFSFFFSFCFLNVVCKLMVFLCGEEAFLPPELRDDIMASTGWVIGGRLGKKWVFLLVMR